MQKRQSNLSAYRIQLYFKDDFGRQKRKTKQIYLPSNLSPKKRNEEIGRIKAEFQAQVLTENDHQTMTFEQLMKEWLENEGHRRKKTTIDGYITSYKRIKEYMGKMPVNTVTTATINKLIVELGKIKAGGRMITEKNREKRKPLSPKTIKNTISFISAVFHYGKKLGYIDRNPCDGAELPRIQKTEKNIYKPIELAMFMSELENPQNEVPLRYEVIVKMALFGGMRLGEIMGLEWKHIEFDGDEYTDKPVIHIRQSKSYIKATNCDMVSTPKTESSKRDLYLDESIFSLLKKLKSHYSEQSELLGNMWDGNSDFVFLTDEGKPLASTSVGKWLKRFCERTSLRFVSMHGFRHMYATLLNSSGVDMNTISKNLGHSDPSITANIYTHTFSESKIFANRIIVDSVNNICSKYQTKSDSDTENENKPEKIAETKSINHEQEIIKIFFDSATDKVGKVIKILHLDFLDDETKQEIINIMAFKNLSETEQIIAVSSLIKSDTVFS